jgi:DNA-binding beta-propeller fold protein YncE
MRKRWAVALGLAAAMAAPASASAADSVIWPNWIHGEISFAALDRSAGGTLKTTVANTGFATGVAVDLVAGRAYYGAYGNTPGMSYAKLDGSGGGLIPVTGATVDQPGGVALDLPNGRMFWANTRVDKISVGRLDGSGGSDLSTVGATVKGPRGIAYDPAARRVYWANTLGNKISFASVDGSGPNGDLNTAGASVAAPWGVAIDVAGGRLFWANQNNNTISFAKLDGSGGGGDLSTAGALVKAPAGVAIDQEAGRVYWANYSGTGIGSEVNMSISFAKLDGSGGGVNLVNNNARGDSDVGKAILYAPNTPAIVKKPQGTGVPTISGGTALGSTLSCTDGTWGADDAAGFVFRVPATFDYAWTRDGQPVAGAASKTLAATQAGAYRCIVNATNYAGTTAQSSAPNQVGSPTTPGTPSTPGTPTTPGTTPGTTTAARITYVRLRGKTVTLKVNTPGSLIVRSPRDQFQSISRKVSAGNVSVTLNLRQITKNQLGRYGKVSVVLTATLKPGGGAKAGTLKRTIVLRP